MGKPDLSQPKKTVNQNLSRIEEEILTFWEKERIFVKLQNSKRKKKFIFYEGPPTANAGPGFHHVIARVFKDVICRYRELKGDLVLRKAGWDTHGLPVELQVEKQIGTKTKSDIENFGVAKFNQLCQKSVWEFKQLWDKFTKRIGYWLDLDNPYITYDPKYIETCWWILKKIWQKNLLDQDYKVVPYCARCGTALASHEVALGYQDVEEMSVYLKFRVQNLDVGRLTAGIRNPVFLLAWTTTPWTLPGNVALAVHPELDYVFVKTETGEVYILAKNRLSVLEAGSKVLKGVKGKDLVGLRYEPMFNYLVKANPKNIENAFKVYPAEFATDEDGTGIVHTAVMYGEDDFNLGKEFNLPFIHTVESDGRFSNLVSDWSGIWVKQADPLIREKLKQENKLFKEEKITHTYPFCWRCQTPLLYYARDSWFIKTSEIKDRLIANNDKIHWEPEYLKQGRFGEWLRENKDWALSRERYWGTPLPIWVCESNPEHLFVAGSLKDLTDQAILKNNYWLMRHGQAESNQKNIHIDFSADKKEPAHLTKLGRGGVERAAEKFSGQNFDLIFASDLTRIKETIAILKKFFPQTKVIYDKRLREINAGFLNGQDYDKFYGFYGGKDWFKKKPENGESFEEVYQRAGEAFLELEKKYSGKNILVVAHGAVLKMLNAWLANLEPKSEALKEFSLAEFRQFNSSALPKNEQGETDLHRPYVDEICLRCRDCNGKMSRVKEVIDVWFDSGAMPLAQFHFPFDQIKPNQDPNKVNYRSLIKKNYPYPADYISEAIDQTRGWFYTLLAISTLLDLGPSYLNVVSIAHVLDAQGEKMSKSKGNTVDPWEMFDRYGADALRWYFYTVNSPGEYKKFSEQGLKISAQELMIVLNVLRFFEFYAPENLKPNLKPQDFLDEWILEKLALLAKQVDRYLSEYRIFEAARSVQGFIDDLSRWYLRRSRKKFQKPDSEKDLIQTSEFFGSLLLEFAKILAPFTPFLADYLWQRVSARFQGVYSLSVHLDLWPKIKQMASSKSLIEEMAQVRKIAEQGLALRAKAGIKVRQPLSALEILKTKISEEGKSILMEELNVKEVKNVEVFSSGIVSEENVGLNTQITEELKQEGWQRELLRLIQEARQQAGLMPQDQISLYLDLPPELGFIKDNVSKFQQEVGAVKLEFSRQPTDFEKQAEIESNQVWIGIKK
ncbi:MAG: class I tRNA ligase family protein [Patescibacteria group bacterium]